ncbi:Beta-barrel assembly-enhancing protease [compost metagenome]
MEREADRTGYGLMAPAGFSPQGMVGMFGRLQQANRLNDNGSWPYLRSHPLTTERMADMQARLPAGQSLAQPAPSLEHGMMTARARVLARPGVDVLR